MEETLPVSFDNDTDSNPSIIGTDEGILNENRALSSAQGSSPVQTRSPSAPSSKKRPRASSSLPPICSKNLSSFFSIVPKEQIEKKNTTLAAFHTPAFTESCEFWSYFQPFFVKPNVKMTPVRPVKNTIADNIEKVKRKSVDDAGVKKVFFRLIQFCENIRPAYFGTVTKKDTLINGRRPFVMDSNMLDYTVDSDCEWEDDECQEGDVEILSEDDCEDEEEEELNEEEDDDDTSWLVPHGYLSEDERNGIDDDADENSANTEDHEQNNDPVNRRMLKDDWKLKSLSPASKGFKISTET